jgi:hypothetical protein
VPLRQREKIQEVLRQKRVAFFHPHMAWRFHCAVSLVGNAGLKWIGTGAGGFAAVWHWLF